MPWPRDSRIAIWKRTAHPGDNSVEYIVRPDYLFDREMWFYPNGGVVVVRTRSDWDTVSGWTKVL